MGNVERATWGMMSEERDLSMTAGPVRLGSVGTGEGRRGGGNIDKAVFKDRL